MPPLRSEDLLDKIIVEGGVPLSGSIRVQGSKNSALPILFATILTEDPCTIRNVPDLSDVDTTMSILRELGMSCEREETGCLRIETDNPDSHTAGYELVSTMRASICTLGPLLALDLWLPLAQLSGCSAILQAPGSGQQGFPLGSSV